MNSAKSKIQLQSPRTKGHYQINWLYEEIQHFRACCWSYIKLNIVLTKQAWASCSKKDDSCWECCAPLKACGTVHAKFINQWFILPDILQWHLITFPIFKLLSSPDIIFLVTSTLFKRYYQSIIILSAVQATFYIKSERT